MTFFDFAFGRLLSRVAFRFRAGPTQSERRPNRVCPTAGRTAEIAVRQVCAPLPRRSSSALALLLRAVPGHELRAIVLPEQLKTLEALDRRLASLPNELASAVTRQPEFKDALAQVKDTAGQVQALERSVSALEKSINSLDSQLTRLATAARPETLRELADHTGGVAWASTRATLLLATACGAALLILQALLRRWSNPALRSA